MKAIIVDNSKMIPITLINWSNTLNFPIINKSPQIENIKKLKLNFENQIFEVGNKFCINPVVTFPTAAHTKT